MQNAFLHVSLAGRVKSTVYLPIAGRMLLSTVRGASYRPLDARDSAAIKPKTVGKLTAQANTQAKDRFQLQCVGLMELFFPGRG